MNILSEATISTSRKWASILFIAGIVAILSGYALSTASLDSRIVLIGSLGILLFSSFRMDAWKYAPWDSRVWLWFALSVSMLASAMFDRSSGKTANLLILAYVSLALVITMIVKFRAFIEVFLHAMRILTVIAIVAHIVFIGLGISPPFERVVNANGVVYANGYVVFMILFGDWVLPRSLSIFWEPGLYASFLTIAIILELCFRNTRPRRISLGLFAVGILLSVSAAGYVLLLLATVLWYFRGGRGAKRLILFVCGAVALWLCIQVMSIIGPLAAFNRDMLQKLQFSEFLNGTRWQSLLLNLKIFADSPILGSGYGGATVAFGAGMAGTSIVAQTSTSTLYLAAFGLPGALFSGAWIVSILKLRDPNLYARLLILACLLIILNKEPHGTILFTNCLMFYFVGESQRLKPSEAASGFRGDIDA